MATATKRTTLAIPTGLLRAVDDLVQRGYARSRNALVADAPPRELATRESAAIDMEFEGVADDPEYQAEALHIAREFAVADWEAFQIGEREYRGEG